MDRDDYRDKLLAGNARKQDLHKNIEQSKSQDMISKQVDGGMGQTKLTKTLVDGRADDAVIIKQKQTSLQNQVIGSDEKLPIKNVLESNGKDAISEEEEMEESALYQKGGNANSFHTNDKDYHDSYKSPRKRVQKVNADVANGKVEGHEKTSTIEERLSVGKIYSRKNSKETRGKYDRKGHNRKADRANSKEEPEKRLAKAKRKLDAEDKVELVGTKTIKDREKKRKLEAKVSDVGYDKSRRVKKEAIKFDSGKDEVPNRSKAREAEIEDANRYQEFITIRKENTNQGIPESVRNGKTKSVTRRKHRYSSVLEVEEVGKFTKRLSSNKGKDKRKRRNKVDAVPAFVVSKPNQKEADANYGVEASERAIYVARYGKKAASVGGKYVTSATRTVRDTTERITTDITTKADLIQQQRRIEAKYKVARRKGQTIKEAMQEIKEFTIKVAHKAQEIVRKNLTLIISIVTVLVLFVAISATLSSCASALAHGAGTYIEGLSPTTDREMTDCDSYMDELENALQETIDNIETDYPDYDEYDYDLAEIGHDYTALMAYLSAEYADYSLSAIQSVIDMLFDEMYNLTMWETVEPRTREEWNPDTEQMEEIEYDALLLHIKLEKTELPEVVETKFSDAGSKERYENYVTTGGAHQVYSNPFDFNWTGDVSSPFGWRIHPISHVKKFHNGLDIAEPGGTPIKSVCTGTVISSYYSSSAGNYIIVQDVTGYTVHYMHLNDRYVAAGTEIKRGELIGTVGTTGNSTGNHLHIGVKDESGEWLNPSFLVSSFVEP